MSLERPVLQNGRMVEVGRFLWRSASPTILLKARKSRPGSSGSCHQVLNISEKEASTVALGSFLACLIIFTVKKKKKLNFV